ncbi:MAG: diaminopimelate decarboxylase [Candidatus Anstonellaceae archaeon]
MLLPPLSSNSQNLLIGNFYISELYSKFGPGPIYVYDANQIIKNYENLKRAFSNEKFKTRIYFAIKANSNPHIIKLLAKRGAGADCSNLNEIKIAQLSGIQKEKILYSGNNNPKAELEYAIKNSISTNFDSLSLFEMVANKKEIKNIVVSFRYNPKNGLGGHKKIITGGKASKFGINEKEIFNAYKLAKKKGIKKFGLHMMSGSNTLKIEPFLKQIKEQLRVAGKISSKLGIEFEFIDIGGGFGVPYRPDEKELDMENLGKKISKEFLNGCLENKIKAPNSEFPDLILEPGRILVANSGVIISEITNIKSSNSKKIVGLYGSMAILMRPSLYDAYHHIYIDGKLNGRQLKMDVVGQACESSDYFAKDRLLPANLKIGDKVVICTTGAYGFSMSNNYCNMSQPPEILVDGKKIKLIRKRQTLQEMLRGVDLK